MENIIISRATPKPTHMRRHVRRELSRSLPYKGALFSSGDACEGPSSAVYAAARAIIEGCNIEAAWLCLQMCRNVRLIPDRTRHPEATRYVEFDGIVPITREQAERAIRRALAMIS